MAEPTDPRDRPPDPAGTQPKVALDSLLPAPYRDPVVDGEAQEVTDELAAGGPEDLSDRPGELVLDGGGGLGPVSADPQRQTAHTARFQFLLGALIALGAVAVAGALALGIGGSTSGDGARWSPWKPAGKDKAKAIAEHVGPEYRLPGGQQLVLVSGGPLEVANLPIRVVLTGGAQGDSGGEYKLLDGKGALYRMCGLGPKCAIATGKPSTQRHLLLRREALELALYTFRYQSSLDQVVVFMPPRKGQDPNQALLFERSHVGAELDRPLQATLTSRTPSVDGIQSSPDAGLVNRLTTSSLFNFSLTQQNQDLSVLLVLQPFSASAPATGGGTSTKPAGTSTTDSTGLTGGSSSSTP